MAADLLERFGLGARGRTIDLGCGTGGNLAVVSSFAPTLAAGVDLSILALDRARRRFPSAPLVRADVNRGLPFRDETVHAVTIFNVLYHKWIADEVEVMRDVARILRPGGLLLATEPAFRSLARPLDEAAMTRRRYRAPEFAALCERAGLSVRFTSYFTTFGAPVALLAKQAGSRADTQPLNRCVNAVFYLAARAEAWAIVRGMRMPFGVTLVCIASKT